jgi:hypothetical protein
LSNTEGSLLIALGLPILAVAHAHMALDVVAAVFTVVIAAAIIGRCGGTTVDG